jgi:hypothetical protein
MHFFQGYVALKTLTFLSKSIQIQPSQSASYLSWEYWLLIGVSTPWLLFTHSVWSFVSTNKDCSQQWFFRTPGSSMSRVITPALILVVREEWESSRTAARRFLYSTRSIMSLLTLRGLAGVSILICRNRKVSDTAQWHGQSDFWVVLTWKLQNLTCRKLNLSRRKSFFIKLTST